MMNEGTPHEEKFLKRGFLQAYAGRIAGWKKREVLLSRKTRSLIKRNKKKKDLKFSLVGAVVIEANNKNLENQFEVFLQAAGTRLLFKAESRVQLEKWRSAIHELALLDLPDNTKYNTHKWRYVKSMRGSTCHKCLSSCGHFSKVYITCEACDTSLHKQCAHTSNPVCKWTTVENIPESLQFHDGMGHQWKERPALKMCNVCDKKISSLGYHCLWCNISAHSSCRLGIAETCSFGRNALSILRPSDVSLPLRRVAEVSPLGDFYIKHSTEYNPLIAFVNTKSGSNDGVPIIRLLRQCLSPAQVFDLSDGGPSKGLRLLRDRANFRALGCGGDGTVGWILHEADKLQISNCQLAVLPLGTGNDLARVLGWGGEYNSTKIGDMLDYLDAVATAKVKPLDRWSVTISNETLPTLDGDPIDIQEDGSDAATEDDDDEEGEHHGSERTGVPDHHRSSDGVVNEESFPQITKTHTVEVTDADLTGKLSPPSSPRKDVSEASEDATEQGLAPTNALASVVPTSTTSSTVTSLLASRNSNVSIGSNAASKEAPADEEGPTVEPNGTGSEKATLQAEGGSTTGKVRHSDSRTSVTSTAGTEARPQRRRTFKLSFGDKGSAPSRKYSRGSSSLLPRKSLLNLRGGLNRRKTRKMTDIAQSFAQVNTIYNEAIGAGTALKQAFSDALSQVDPSDLARLDASINNTPSGAPRKKRQSLTAVPTTPINLNIEDIIATKAQSLISNLKTLHALVRDSDSLSHDSLSRVSESLNRAQAVRATLEYHMSLWETMTPAQQQRMIANLTQTIDHLIETLFGFVPSTTSAHGEAKGSERAVMNNYFGVGIDAQIAYKFDRLRRNHPEKCRSRSKNKFWYGIMGFQEMANPQFPKLQKHIKVICDGRVLDLPKIQGLVVANISSYMGGVNMWGHPNERRGVQEQSDGKLEVVALKGSLQMAMTKSVPGYHPIRLCQASVVEIHIIGQFVPVQVDGEPWLQNPCVIRIEKKNTVQMLARDKAFQSRYRGFEWERHEQDQDPYSLLAKDAQVVLAKVKSRTKTADSAEEERIDSLVAVIGDECTNALSNGQGAQSFTRSNAITFVNHLSELSELLHKLYRVPYTPGVLAEGHAFDGVTIHQLSDDAMLTTTTASKAKAKATKATEPKCQPIDEDDAEDALEKAKDAVVAEDPFSLHMIDSQLVELFDFVEDDPDVERAKSHLPQLNKSLLRAHRRNSLHQRTGSSRHGPLTSMDYGDIPSSDSESEDSDSNDGNQDRARKGKKKDGGDSGDDDDDDDDDLSVSRQEARAKRREQRREKREQRKRELKEKKEKKRALKMSKKKDKAKGKSKGAAPSLDAVEETSTATTPEDEHANKDNPPQPSRIDDNVSNAAEQDADAETTSSPPPKEEGDMSNGKEGKERQQQEEDSTNE